MQKIRILSFISFIFLTYSCVSYYESVRKSTDVDFKYTAAKKFFNEKQFKKAVDVFEDLVLLSQGTPLEDTINYYTALSRYKYGDFTAAEGNFNKFISEFPRSPFTEEARFLRIICLFESTYRYELDQLPTHKAMSVISEFMRDNPQNKHYEECSNMLKELKERLDRKSFEAAKLYYKVEDYKAANSALKGVLKDNADNQYREEILYYTALSSYRYAENSVTSKQKERFMNFADDYYNFISEFPQSKYRKELDNLFEKIKKNKNN